MIPLPTVFATAVVTNAPARLAIAAIATARRGDSARVETEVATAFAVSWKPFVKSKPERDDDDDDEEEVAPMRLPVLDEDRLEHVGGVLAGVDRLLEPLVDVLPADDRSAGPRPSGRARRRRREQPVALVLELAQRDQLLARVLEALEQLDRLVQLRSSRAGSRRPAARASPAPRRRRRSRGCRRPRRRSRRRRRSPRRAGRCRRGRTA